MSIHWRLKTYVATRHGIYGAVALQKIIVRKTGVLISIQNLCNYLEKKPKSIPLKTIEILCTALACCLHDFCEVKPLPPKKPEATADAVRKLSYQNTPLSKRASQDFPDPKNYSG